MKGETSLHRRSICLFALFVGFSVMVHAQTPNGQVEPWRDWSNLSRLQFQQKLRVETAQPKRKLKARFVSHDDSGITIQLSDGRSETIAKTDVRRLLAERESTKPAVLAGVAAGGIVFAALVAGEEDIVPSGKALFIGIGAGIGALGGWGVGAMAKTKLIYEAPKR